MAESNYLSESLLEKLRCFQCKHFLSISPIILLPDGNSLCGLCSTSTNQTTYRELLLESFLKTLNFPCKFRKYGCTGYLQFGETQEHEAKCSYRPRTCPVTPSCTWEGAVLQMFDHFNKDHLDLFVDKIEFKLNVRNKDEHGLVLAHVNGVNGILRYFYSFAFGNLQYDIQHFNNNCEELLLKISVTNDLDSDYKVHMKGVSAFFNDSFYRDFRENPNSNMLSLSNLFPILNNPDCIVIKMDWQVDKSIKISKQNEGAQPVNTSKEQEIVDYALIEPLKCDICRYYLLPPLYKNPGCVMCWYCHTKYPQAELVLEKDVLEKVEKPYFPCRWRGCELIKPGSAIINHELSCTSRMYNCRTCDKNTFTRENIIVHSKQHRYHYFQDCHTLRIDFVPVQRSNYDLRFLTVKNNNIIYITCWVYPSSCQLEVYDEYNKDTVVTVEVEHDHCKAKPTFNLTPSESVRVLKDSLPACFKYKQEIKVTLKLQ